MFRMCHPSVPHSTTRQANSHQGYSALLRGRNCILPGSILKSELMEHLEWAGTIFYLHWKFGEPCSGCAILASLTKQRDQGAFTKGHSTLLRGGKARFPTFITKFERLSPSQFETPIFAPRFRFGEMMSKWFTHTVHSLCALVAEPLEGVVKHDSRHPLPNLKGSARLNSKHQSLPPDSDLAK